MRGDMLNSLNVIMVNNIVGKFSHHYFVSIAYIINIHSLNIFAEKRFCSTGFSEINNKVNDVRISNANSYSCIFLLKSLQTNIMQSSPSKAVNVLFYSGKLYFTVHKISNNSFLFSLNLKTRKKMQDDVQRLKTITHSCIFLFTKSLQTNMMPYSQFESFECYF